MPSSKKLWYISTAQFYTFWNGHVAAAPNCNKNIKFPPSLRDLSQQEIFAVEPGTPAFVENDIGNNYFNVTFRPADFDEKERAPVGNTFLVQYKEDGAGEDDWKTVKQDGESLDLKEKN